jgi:DNA polymerase III subunit delta'
MFFKDVIGQEEVKKAMTANCRSGRISHAQLLAGNKGSGGLPLAVAYARYVLCAKRQEDDACGNCPSCLKINNLSHPDLHFSFPFPIKENNITSDSFLTEWRTQFLSEPYFDILHWQQRTEEGAKRPIISVAEGANIMHKINNLSSSLKIGFRPLISRELRLTLLKMYRDTLKKRWEVNGCLLADCF